MRILIATDAWHPQINGVVRTLAMTAAAAKPLGVDIRFLTPESFRTVALPGYSGMRVALPAPTRIAALIAEANPDSIHIATEGPIAFWYAAIAASMQGRSRRASIPVFRITFRRGRRFPKPGYGPRCAGFMVPAGR